MKRLGATILISLIYKMPTHINPSTSFTSVFPTSEELTHSHQNKK